MDKELLSYLANLATVRTHINTILNVGRGVIDKKSLHQVQARAGSLDSLFVQALLSGRTPNSSVRIEDDYVDITQRVLEEKAKLAGKSVPAAQTAPATKLNPAQKALLADEEEEDNDKPFAPPEEEIEAVQSLLEKAEKQVSRKKK